MDLLFRPEQTWIWIVAALGSLAMGWLIGRATVASRSWGRDPLGAIMAATVQRRSRRETLGHLLEAVVRVVRAESAVAYLVDPRTSQLEAVYAIGVEHFDQVARVPVTDPLVQALGSHAGEVLQVEVDNPSLRWAALAHGRARALALIKIGSPRGMRVEQFVLLGWQKRAPHTDTVWIDGRVATVAATPFYDPSGRRARG